MVLCLSGWQTCWFDVYLDVGARNFIFLSCLLLSCFCCELWISPSTCLQSENTSWSSVICNPESSLTLLLVYTPNMSEHHTGLISNIHPVWYSCRYLSVITNICYLYFYNNFLTGSTTFFSLSFEADIYLAFSDLLSALALLLCASVLNWLTLCCPLGSTWQRSVEGSQWEGRHCRGFLVF